MLTLRSSGSSSKSRSQGSLWTLHVWQVAFIYYFTLPLLLSGFTTTSSMRTGSRCTLGTELQSFITTKPFLPGFGSTGRTPVVWLSASLPRPRFYWVSCFFKLLRGGVFFPFHRCSQCWLFWCSGWQMSHWRGSITGDFEISHQLKDSKKIIIKFISWKKLRKSPSRWNRSSWRPAPRESSPATMGNASTLNNGWTDHQSFVVDDSSAVTNVSPQLWPDLKLFWRVRRR